MGSYQSKISRLQESTKRTVFFATAFMPLWSILLINYAVTANPEWPVIVASAAFLVVLTASMLAYLRRKHTTKGESVSFKIVKKCEITHDVVFYVLAYVPIFLIQKFEFSEILTFAILIFTIYVLYTKTNMLHINPIISLFYKTYRVTDNYDNTIVVFSKLHIKTGTDIQCHEITHNLNINIK